MEHEREYDVTLGVAVAFVGTACAAVGTSYMKYSMLKYAFLFMGIGVLLNFVAYQFAPQSVVAPMGGFVVFWTVLMDPKLSKRSWKLWFYVGCVVAGCGLVAMGATHTVAKDVGNPYLGLAAFLGTAFGVLVLVFEPTVAQPVMPGIQGGFADTMLKAFDIALRHGEALPLLAYGTCLVAFGLTQFVLLDKALKNLTEVQVNPIYIVSLSTFGTATAFTIFGEFHTDKMLGYVGGFVLAAFGTYRLSVLADATE